MSVITREEARTIREQARLAGKRVGFTSGHFDLLHRGHLEYLQTARSYCDMLIVAVNSDRVTRLRKGFTRPIVLENDRVAMVAGLKPVDAAFIFDEETNQTNITTLKPDLYLKAGDYSKDKLSSAPIVESYGGEVVLVPFVPGLSTTGLVERIQGRLGVEAEPIAKQEMSPCAFLDRDGTLVELVEYLHEPAKVKLIPKVGEGLLMLQNAGFRLVIVTNQPGIGIGYFSEEDFFATNREFLKQVSAYGVRIDKIYVSPYSKADQSPCRKPSTGLVDRAFRELAIDRSKTVFIGDMTGDIQCGVNAGVRTILVETGRGGKDGEYPAIASATTPSLYEAAELAVKWHSYQTNS